MSPTAFALIITSAFMHAWWNFVSKKKEPSLAFFFLTTVSAAIFISPLLFLYWNMIPLIPDRLWWLILATGIAQMIYFLGLAGAYKNGDLSLAYPVARSLPVLFIALISLTSDNGGDLGTLSLIGMVLITIGCIIIPVSKFRNFRLQDYYHPVYLMAVVAALGTTGYTLIDSSTLHQLRHTTAIQGSISEITLLFIMLQTISTTIIIGITTMIIPQERRKLSSFSRNRAVIFSGFGTGIVIMITYGLVLASMSYVTDVSYVAAFRQLSIPIGALLGLTLQNEPRFIPKIIGICIVSMGLILVAVG